MHFIIFLESPKYSHSPIYTFAQYQTLAPTCKHQEQRGVRCLAQGPFDLWAYRAETKPVIFQSQVNRSTSALFCTANPQLLAIIKCIM